jgi:hypothetical protein
MQGREDMINEAIAERKSQIINEAEDEELIEILEQRGYKITKETECKGGNER